jgi:aldose 1-epimerase
MLVQTTKTLEIASGSNCCAILPNLGGSIASWSVAGQNMFRATAQASIDRHEPLGTATFPLVPYSNRIAMGRFDWQGQAIKITPNFAPEPHAIHGTGWEDAWVVDAKSHHEVTLSLDHPGDDRWPWAFEARQTLTVTDTMLSIAVTARNKASMSVPLAFGHHPAFNAKGASLQFAADTFWNSGPDMLPTTAVAPTGMYNFDAIGAVEGRIMDNCFSGWDGRAKISWAEEAFALEISAPMSAAVVYIPGGGDFFCFEPVPHVNNALGMPGARPAMPVIAPGESYSVVMTFQAIPAR